MKDLTQGSITRHLFEMAIPMMIGLIIQTLYVLVDTYFVARVGDTAVAGLGAASNIAFVVMALTQMLGVGTVALMSHAAGRKDQADANLVFNQTLVLSGLLTVLALAGGWGLSRAYMSLVGADPATTEAGVTYLYWYTPGLALQFALVAMGSALRGTGIVKPTMVVQMLTVLLNIVLAPILIAGWGTGHPLGVAGAGLASSLAIAVGVVLLAVYFFRLEKYVAFHPDLWRPRLETWKRILAIGLPAGGEFLLMSLIMGVIYWIIRDFGSVAQAGFGAGSRVMQAIFLPAMALAFATAPIAGQNYGAGQAARVRETFRVAALIGSAIMLTLTLLCQMDPSWLVSPFTNSPDAVAVGAQFLHFISWNFVASGLLFTCSGMFQGLGNTLPSLFSTATRLVTFMVPAVWLSHQSGFRLEHVWYLSVASVAVQALTSLLLLRREFGRRLPGLVPRAAPAPAA